MFYLKDVHSVNHHFTKHNIEQFSPPVWHSSSFNIHISTLQWLRTVEMKTRIEEGGVLASDDAALVLSGQSSVVQLRLVRHVDAEPVQVVDIVCVGGDLVCNMKTWSIL